MTGPGPVRAGALFGLLGAFAFSFTVVIGRVLSKAGVPAPATLGMRFSLAGLLLLLVLAAGRRPLLPAAGERVGVFLLGAAGYALESTCFYLGLGRGTAAAVTLLFYSYPALVTALEIPLARHRPPARNLWALALSIAGAGLIAGGTGRVRISATGIAFALGAAATFAVYLVVGERIARRTDSLTTGTWVAIGAGVSLLTRAAIEGDLGVRARHLDDLAAYGLSTAVAFVMLFAALRRLGPSRTAVVMTLEAVFAILLAALFLDEGIGWPEAVGGTAILGAAALIALERPVAPAERETEVASETAP